MSDFNSSQPVRTQTTGDVIVQIADGTLTSSLLNIDSSGRVTTKLDDGAGNVVTSQASGAQRALDVGINVAGVQVDPRQTRALTAADVVTVVDPAEGSVAPGTAGTKSQLVGAVYNSAGVTLTTGQQASLQLDAAGRLLVDVGTSSAITVNQGTSPWVTQDAADGSVAAGAAGTKSLLGGLVYNSSAPTLTTGQQVALQGDVNGNLKVDLATAIPAGANIIGSIATVSAVTAITNALPAGTNLIGGTNVYVGGAIATVTNPVPVVMTTNLPGTLVNKYNTTATVAIGSTANHVYTITTGKTFSGKKFFASASGKIRADVQTSPDGTTYTTFWTAFNSTSNPNISIDLDLLSLTDSGTGSTIRITIKNDDLAAFDVFSTISGVEN